MGKTGKPGRPRQYADRAHKQESYRRRVQARQEAQRDTLAAVANLVATARRQGIASYDDDATALRDIERHLSRLFEAELQEAQNRVDAAHGAAFPVL